MGTSSPLHQIVPHALFNELSRIRRSGKVNLACSQQTTLTILRQKCQNNSKHADYPLRILQKKRLVCCVCTGLISFARIVFRADSRELTFPSGKLHASSSRTYGVVDWTSGRRLIEPYGWNSDLTTSTGRRQRFLSQNLFVDRLFVFSDPARGVISLTADTAISKVSGAVCPEGFEIVLARIDGRRQLLGAANLDYCRGTPHFH